MTEIRDLPALQLHPDDLVMWVRLGATTGADVPFTLRWGDLVAAVAAAIGAGTGGGSTVYLVTDPITGRPVTDPITGQPVIAPVRRFVTDPITGALVLDPNTHQPIGAP